MMVSHYKLNTLWPHDNWDGELHSVNMTLLKGMICLLRWLSLYICSHCWFTFIFAAIADLRPGGYVFEHRPRLSKRGGGVAFLYKDHLQVAVKPPDKYDSFESVSSTVTSDSSSMDITVMYRPPGNQNFSTFLEDFSEFLDGRICRMSPLVITGDLNIHFDNCPSQNTQKFNDLISTHGISQLVSSPTHDKGHILDIVLVRNSDRGLRSGLQVVPGISDHSAITWNFSSGTTRRTDSVFTCRNIKGIDRVAFAKDVTDSNIMPLTSGSVDNAVRRYNTELSRILDCHAPAKNRKISSLWFILNQIKLMLDLLSIALKLAWMIFKLGCTLTL